MRGTPLAQGGTTVSWIREIDRPAHSAEESAPPNIERVMSLHAAASEAAMALHATLSGGASALSAADEEALATAVSWRNGCEY